MENKFLILQSGFLSFESEYLARSVGEDERQMLKDIDLGKADSTPDNPYYYSREIEAIYNIYNNDSRVLMEFDFRERVLSAVKAAFQVTKPWGWLELQLDSPFLTAIHRKFLVETFSYIIGCDRSMSVESWIPLIGPRTAVETDRVVKIRDTIASMKPVDINTMLQKWTMRTNGFSDMIVSSKIIFGKQFERSVF